jgi:uncharacterized protein YcgI (DUF1989 family)
MAMSVVPGRIVREQVIAAREHAAVTMSRGQVLRIVEVEDQQVADLVCFNLHHLKEALSCGNTKSVYKTYKLTTGHALLSNDCNRMLTIVADTVGAHYVGASFCSEEMNFVRFGVRGTRNCRDNLATAVEPWGISKYDLSGAFDPFMNVPHYPDGRVETEAPLSKAGDYLDLRAEMDLLVALSACPQERNPCNAGRAKPIGFIVYELPAAG